MTTTGQDRVYWHVPNGRSWHGNRSPFDPADGGFIPKAYCGFVPPNGYAVADRLPPTAHLCGNCSRIIAARTDIEGKRIGRLEFKRGELARVADLQEAAIRTRILQASEDVPEPVASEQDDSA